jgi:FkbM family methyltransferase
MSAIDIGANLGVYSLQMARLVGPTGHVFAYEPGSAARNLLERSRELNRAAQLHISPFALSDRSGEGNLVFGGSSELNALGETGTGETVRLTSLDSEDAARGWPPPDFVKVDAEGEEERIFAGGQAFFARHSPLVMFEADAPDKTNKRLRRLLAMGYGVFRQLGGEPVLVPIDADEALDAFEINLFAAKKDRARTLAQRGLLVEAIGTWAASRSDRKHAEAFWRRQAFASATGGARQNQNSAEPPDYPNALAAYAVWRNSEQTLPTRCAALGAALRHARSACMRVPTAVRLSTLSRIASEWGARTESAGVLQRLLGLVEGGRFRLDEPFWPASARFDHIAPGDRPADWFVAAAAEQFEKIRSLSTAFVAPSVVLPWLSQQPFCRTEMVRRRVLYAARTGQRPEVPARLCEPADDHLNAHLWRTCRVPGTILAAQ